MNKPLITILTVNYKTSDFIDLMLYAFEKLTKNSYKVIICDNYSTDKEMLKIAKVAQKYQDVELVFRKQTQFGSIGHAEAMDLLVSKVDTPYFVTMDADCTFLLNGWDELLISQLDDSIKVIGTTLPKGPENPKPMDFPLVFAVLYETESFKKLNPSFMPDDIKKDKSKDTGWEIRERYLSAHFKSIVFDGENTRFVKTTEYGDMICAVYYYKDNLIASHFSRGSSDGIAKYNNRWYFQIPLFSRILKRLKGMQERKSWIDISYNIVDRKA
jgi:glycosyltransferase involved in cell wall biosynthesis